jgi:flagellar biosynthesis/type III secretory pathway M-ring protein FliF/YscJ
LSLRSNRLDPDGRVSIGDRTYERWATTQTIEGGDRLQVQATAQASGAGLNVGIALAAVLAAGLVGFALVRRRTPREPEAMTAYGGHPVPETREHLLSLIAALDLRYRAGDISEQQWAERRAELKERLANLPQPEPAP